VSRFVQVPPLDIGRRGLWVLAGALLYYSDLLEQVIRIGAGFETDLASIPKWVPRWIVDVNGKHREAAILHDYLCRKKDFDRAMADRIFLEAMVVLGVKRWRRNVMYAAVSASTLYLKARRKA
jgi:hypothetical protein